MKEVELYYTVTASARQLSLHPRTVVLKLKAREFGPDVVNLGSEAAPDYRIPASGLRYFLDARRLFPSPPEIEPVPSEPIAARSIGELRRKAMK